MKVTPKTGVAEWAEHKVNIQTGCEHDCRMCYARANAVRFKRITSPEAWARPRIRPQAVERNYPYRPGITMYPTSHDVTPLNINESIAVLLNLLGNGNQVLIVSKPHLECIERLCGELLLYRDQITFRFTIGALSDSILSAWEPGAPPFAERFAALKHACRCGYRMSVSMEPLLDQPHVLGLFRTLKRYVAESIWIGKLNKIRERTIGVTEKEIQRVLKGQTERAVRETYKLLKDEPLVRWKDSYRAVLGIP